MAQSKNNVIKHKFGGFGELCRKRRDVAACTRTFRKRTGHWGYDEAPLRCPESGIRTLRHLRNNGGGLGGLVRGFADSKRMISRKIRTL